MYKKPTIYDVAKAANTSAATVSRVLSKSKYPVKKELKEKVIKEAKNLKYIPNLIGKQLKNKKSNDIGVIIPNITNQFYPQLILGIEHVARNLGYNVLLCNSQRDARNEKNYLKSLLQKQIEGIIISSLQNNHKYLGQLIENGSKIVVFDQNISFNCNKVILDFEKVGYLAAKHLIEMGHKEIGFISAPLNKYSRSMIYKGFMNSLIEFNIDINKEYILVSDEEYEFHDEIYEYRNGRILAMKMLSNKNFPTAIFCINDMTAIGVMRTLQNNNIKIPEDISIVGFDNIPISQMVSPSLTTIDQCTYKMGKIATKVLIKALKENNSNNTSIFLEPYLVVRESTKKYGTYNQNKKMKRLFF
jgi:LacI family transcriptional regulator